jgi:hypothetical protein
MAGTGRTSRTRKVRTCKVCGCTDTRACEGGCWWVGPELCSRCGKVESGDKTDRTNRTDRTESDRSDGLAGSERVGQGCLNDQLS